MKVERLFRILIVLEVLGFLVCFISREVFEYSYVAFEGLTVISAGLLIVTGMYFFGYEEGKEDGEKI